MNLKHVSAHRETDAASNFESRFVSLTLCPFLRFFQLRYLQTLNTISAEKNSTIIFPVPMDIISHLFNKKEN